MGFNLEDYEPVAARIAKFWQDHPNGAIYSELVFDDGNRCVIKSEVWFDITNPRPTATDYAEELLTDRGVNSTSRIENGTTSAHGRALAAAGYLPSDWSKKPSREEMAKVQRLQSVPNAPQKPQEATGDAVRVRGSQHGELPQWLIMAALEQHIYEVYDNRDTLHENPKRPWFKCTQSKTGFWPPKGTPIPQTAPPVVTLPDEEPF